MTSRIEDILRVFAEKWEASIFDSTTFEDEEKMQQEALSHALDEIRGLIEKKKKDIPEWRLKDELKYLKEEAPHCHCVKWGFNSAIDEVLKLFGGEK